MKKKNDMTKEVWDSWFDDEKTQFMRGVFADFAFGQEFDYAKERDNYERWQERLKTEGAPCGVTPCKNPCLVLTLIDPILAEWVFSWMYRGFNKDGTTEDKGETKYLAPIFGYVLDEYVLDKHSLMQYSDSERQILADAVKILNKQVKAVESVTGTF